MHHASQAIQPPTPVLIHLLYCRFFVAVQQPDVAELQQVLQSVAQHMVAASAAAENRRSAAFNQLKVVAEALQGLSWLAYTGPSCGKAMHAGCSILHLMTSSSMGCYVTKSWSISAILHTVP
jgi:hypothetical protein